MNNQIDERNKSIGFATLKEDGTLILNLRRSFDTRFSFQKVLTILPSNPRYRQYIANIGGITAGERKSIPAAPRQRIVDCARLLSQGKRQN